jgi:formamidopyrimidine-DNA glycosylase
MPELPEVEVVRRGLEAHVLGRRIISVEVLHPRPVRRHTGGPDDFEARLVGHRFIAARRRGKYLWLALDDPTGSGQGPGDALLGHLGMSGQMLVQPPGVPDERHLRVRFLLAAPDGPRRSAARDADGGLPNVADHPDLELRFVDQRMFGGLAVSEGGAVLPPEIAHIARDPLDEEFDDAAFVTRVRRSDSGIKRLLLNQDVVSGVGNIYADEGLWLARVHGERPGSRLRRSDVERVLAGCRQVMLEALGQGGTSFDALYVNVNGQSGYFDRALQVYGREAEPCSRCGTPIRRVTFMNRSSFYCPVCQPAPRRTSAARLGTGGPSRATASRRPPSPAPGSRP